MINGNIFLEVLQIALIFVRQQELARTRPKCSKIHISSYEMSSYHDIVEKIRIGVQTMRKIR